MGARLRRPASTDIRLIEKAGDVGGTWYWNRYPGAMCDVESYVYLPLLEELGYIPKHKYSFAPEILEYSRTIARHFDLYDDALFQTGVTELRWDDDRRALDHQHRPRRPHAGPLRGDGQRPAEPAEAARHPRHQRLQGPHVPHQPLGLRLHRRRLQRRTSTKLADKRVGIIGTGATAIQCIPHLGECGQGALRLPAHAVVGRRPQQPRDRPRVGRLARAGLAAAADGQLQHPRQRRRPGRGPRRRRLDRHLPQPHRHRRQDGQPQARPPAHAAGEGRADGARRLPEDGGRPRPGSRTSSRTRRRPRSSSRGTASSASGRASTTSTCRRSTGPTSTWSTPRARASSASPSAASSSTAPSTRSTA